MKVLDTISATNVGGRNGKGKSSDGKVEIQFSLAKALGGKGRGRDSRAHVCTRLFCLLRQRDAVCGRPEENPSSA